MADQGTEGLLSPFLRRHRIMAVRPFLMGRILDVGCGSGALAGLINPESYVGVEIDEASLKTAENAFPRHSFQKELHSVKEKFDTVVSLAVIEHVQNPANFLRTLTQCLKDEPNGRIVITTPHPSIDWVHCIGASIGLFSKHANDEHEKLLDREELSTLSKSVGLMMVKYSRFLFGGNQLAVFARNP
ncbi:class I SAM-dependent methyltransferase [Desulfatitalea alkaliphila]|uniref:Class I SAM-dependent methyltransferase n=1 Tax=Desulfatitalea alkaliphila TaxID=2929485 RepID=A0AA41R3A8_9BACT|nr:class I SAM-dependent methyltransferase [Desulfatitalea alkaliphila]MCJ8501247.1 class I SAM-dependent methyltransferase [Desulfatitalea alkaliphila]